MIMYGLKKELIESIRQLASKYNIRKVLLFGSRARGDFKERSDIDLAVSGGDVIAFSFAVDEETPTLLMFDIVNLDENVQQELLDSIGKESVVLYEKV
ncbi:MAG: nucleotidyltransferase domain-containing protein [Phascolarctobacterium sp.]|nr:nucleotidyltransferase domain-containing protein [Phascolarctobacterium sp.]